MYEINKAIKSDKSVFYSFTNVINTVIPDYCIITFISC